MDPGKLWFDMGMGTTMRPQVLVYVTTYQGSILVPIFDPQPYRFLKHPKRVPAIRSRALLTYSHLTYLPPGSFGGLGQLLEWARGVLDPLKVKLLAGDLRIARFIRVFAARVILRAYRYEVRATMARSTKFLSSCTLYTFSGIQPV